MSILDRAADLLDRVLSRATAETQQAARRVRAAAEIAALEERLGDLRARLEQRVSELGKLAFQQWKNSAADWSAAMDELCRSIDELNGDYQRLLGELADLKAWAAVPAMRPGAAGLSPSLPMPPEPQPLFPVAARGADGAERGLAGAGDARCCSECLAEVPAGQQYCPMCGMRVE